MFKVDSKTLKEIRLKLKYRKAEMVIYLRGKDIKCSLTSLTNWESGVNSPTDEKTKHILAFLRSKGYVGRGIMTE